MNKNAEILKKAKEHISDPEMWIKGTYFSGPEENAPCCMLGAMKWALDSVNPHDVNELSEAFLECRDVLLHLVSEEELHEFNDSITTTHDDVMKVFEEGIAIAESQV